jgi:hypothetical protein
VAKYPQLNWDGKNTIGIAFERDVKNVLGKMDVFTLWAKNIKKVKLLTCPPNTAPDVSQLKEAMDQVKENGTLETALAIWPVDEMQRNHHFDWMYLFPEQSVLHLFFVQCCGYVHKDSCAEMAKNSDYVQYSTNCETALASAGLVNWKVKRHFLWMCHSSDGHLVLNGKRVDFLDPAIASFPKRNTKQVKLASTKRPTGKPMFESEQLCIIKFRDLRDELSNYGKLNVWVQIVDHKGNPLGNAIEVTPEKSTVDSLAKAVKKADERCTGIPVALMDIYEHWKREVIRRGAALVPNSEETPYRVMLPASKAN